MPDNDHRPGPRREATRSVPDESRPDESRPDESRPGNTARGRLHVSQAHRALRDIEPAELRRLAEEGKASGLSDEDGEALIDRLEVKYRGLAARKSEA
jgi:hypothetical protein